MKRVLFQALIVLACTGLLPVQGAPADHPVPPPLPARIGGPVTINGAALPYGFSTSFTFQVAKPDGTAFSPAAQDSDGLNETGWYVIDIPVYDPVLTPGGAVPGSTVKLRSFFGGREVTVTSPANGQLTVGASGSITRVDLALRSIYGIGGLFGVGIQAPERALHLTGGNAVFQMDRSESASAFLMVRTDGAGAVQKGFLAGTEATEANTGQFVFRDTGTSVADGAGTNRLTIGNDGTVTFGETVKAKGFVTTSSARWKENIRPLENAAELVSFLHGVRYRWKADALETAAGDGAPCPANGSDGKARQGGDELGFIAGEVAPVVPEAVQADGATGRLGVNCHKLLTIALESLKKQQEQLNAIARQRDELMKKLRAR